MKTSKSVRYIGNDYFTNLTHSKIYTILKYVPSLFEYIDRIHIVDERGISAGYFIYDVDRMPLFEDATIELRNEIIGEILE